MDLSENMEPNEESALSEGRLVLADFMEEKSNIDSPDKGRCGWRMVRRCSEYEDLSVDVSTGKITFSSDGIRTPCLQKRISSENLQKPSSQVSDKEQWNTPKINITDQSGDNNEMLDQHFDPKPSTSENDGIKEVQTFRKFVVSSVPSGPEEMYLNEDYHISQKDYVSLIRKKAFKSKLCKAMSIDTPLSTHGIPSRRRNLHLQTQSFDQDNDEYLPTSN